MAKTTEKKAKISKKEKKSEPKTAWESYSEAEMKKVFALACPSSALKPCIYLVSNVCGCSSKILPFYPSSVSSVLAELTNVACSIIACPSSSAAC